MKKIKNNYFKIMILFFFVFDLFIATSVYAATSYYEYRNELGLQTTICGYEAFKQYTSNDGTLKDSLVVCNERVKKEYPSAVTECVISLAPCSAANQGFTSVTPQDAAGTFDDTYNLLAPIGDLTTAPTNIGDYFNTIFNLAIALCAVLAVVMIVIGGVQYMGDESIFGKTEAKKKIFSAILGLIIALGSYALLNTINPALLGGGGVTINSVSATIGGDTDAPIGNTSTLPSGIICSGGKINIPNIAKSFGGKMTYQMGEKGNTISSDGIIKLDCSGFVNYVLKCADVPFVNGGTASIFNGAESVKTISGAMVNDKVLSIGDLVGWRAGENGEQYGHVMIYIGSGQIQVADSHGKTTPGNALGIFSISQYQDRIKYIKRAP